MHERYHYWQVLLFDLSFGMKLSHLNSSYDKCNLDYLKSYIIHALENLSRQTLKEDKSREDQICCHGIVHV